MDNHYLQSETNNSAPQPRGGNVLQFIGIFLRAFGFYMTGVTIVMFLFLIPFNFENEKLQDLFNSTDENSKVLLLIMQGLTQLVGFIILPLLYVKYFNSSLFTKFHFKFNTPHYPILLLLVILIFFSYMPLIAWLQDWNKSIQLPEFMAGLEKSMQASETRAKIMTEKLIYYSDIKGFLFALLVIAVLPAIGEELLFRGITQNEFLNILKNPHAAIWITGFLFSLLHFQFYGFFPRMLLGVTFGYLYYWSGNLAIPMFIHFLNNALTLVVMNLYKQKIITIDPESADSIPSVTIIISLLVFIFLLASFKKYNTTDKINNSY